MKKPTSNENNNNTRNQWKKHISSNATKLSITTDTTDNVLTITNTDHKLEKSIRVATDQTLENGKKVTKRFINPYEDFNRYVGPPHSDHPFFSTLLFDVMESQKNHGGNDLNFQHFMKDHAKLEYIIAMPYSFTAKAYELAVLHVKDNRKYTYISC